MMNSSSATQRATNDTRQCVPTITMRSYLDERLSAEEEGVILQHIEACPSCLALMEQLAGREQAWSNVVDHLAPPTEELPDIGDVAEGESFHGHDRVLSDLKAFLAPTDDPRMMGRLGHYEVCGLVGRGSSGLVVKAFDPRLGRYVAIKLLSTSFASHGAARCRFEREAKSIAAVKSDHVVPIYDVSEHDGLPYIVMEYVPGGSLGQRIRTCGPLESCEIVRLGMQIANGLAAAHRQGIIHRDVKPANVMLEPSIERAMVTDFGLARVADDAAMTRSGVIAGTPQYMSPEQANGDRLDARSDLFSLGSVLYTACTGRAPFRSESVYGVIKRVCEANPRSITEINPSIAPWLAEFVHTLMAQDRDDRFDSAEQVAGFLANELAHMQSPDLIPAPERPWQAPVKPERTPRMRTMLPAFASFAGVAAACVVVTAVIASVAMNWRSEVAPDGPNVQRTSYGQDFALRVAGLAAAGDPEDALCDSGDADENCDGECDTEITEGSVGIPGKTVAIRGNFSGKIIDGYTLFLPVGYGETERDFPVIVDLCGGCGVGGDISDACTTTRVGGMLVGAKAAPESVRVAVSETFIVVCPHMIGGAYEDRQFYEQEEAFVELLTELSAGYRVDTTRVYLTGAGRGGHGVWGLASRRPELFAAIAPMRALKHGVESHASLATLPIWAAHDIDDTDIDFEETLDVVDGVVAIDGRKFRNLGGDVPDDADELRGERRVFTTDRMYDIYSSAAFYAWLLQFDNRV